MKLTKSGSLDCCFNRGIVVGIVWQTSIKLWKNSIFATEPPAHSVLCADKTGDLPAEGQ